MSSIALEHGQSHFRYGPELPFEEELFIDPTDATNNWRDLDQDGISDYNETHYGEAYGWLVEWAKQKSRDYNNSDKSGEDFNATNYLEKQFNPFVKENIPPIILSMSITTQKEDVYLEIPIFSILGPATYIKIWAGYHFYTDIRAKLYDTGDISKVVIWKDFGNGAQVFTSSSNGWYNTTIDIGVFEALTLYVVHVVAEDHAGNALKYNYTVKGIVCKVLDFVIDLWNAFVDTMHKAWDAVAKAANFIMNWIIDTMKNMVNAAVSAIKAALDSFVSGFASKLKLAYESGGAIGEIVGLVDYIFTSSLYWLLLGMITSLFATELIAKAIIAGTTAGVGAALFQIVQPILISAVIAIISHAISTAIESHGETLQGLLELIGIGAGFGGAIADGIKIYTTIKQKRSLNEGLRSAMGDLFSFVYGIVGLILVLKVKYSGALHLLQDIVGLGITVYGRINGQEGHADKLSGVAEAGEFIGNLCLGVSLGVMLMTDYGD